MDLGSTIIGAILIALFTIPFISTSRNRKKRERQLFQSLTKIAIKHDCQLSQHEICGNFGIGIDETKNFVVFYEQTKDKVIEEFIDLANIQNCNVINTSRNIANKGGNDKVIDKLELSFIPMDKNQKETTLEFFNMDVSIQLFDELKSVQKWSKLINDRMKINK